MQGLYQTKHYPVSTGCTKCKQVAMPFANMQRGMALIIELAADLFSDDSFATMGASNRMKKLYSAFMFFWQFGVNLDSLY